MEESHISDRLKKKINLVLGWIELVLLTSITLVTLAAVASEFHLIYKQGEVALSDILLLFIYLEILSMVHQYVNNGKLPVRYPIYIAIIAIARYIILGMKEMDGLNVIWLSLAILVLAFSTLAIRFGHHYWPYKKLLSNQTNTDKN